MPVAAGSRALSRPLSAMDRALLSYEEVNAATPIAVAQLLWATGPAPSLETFQDAVAARSRRFPVLLDRLAYPTGPGRGPVWEPDPGFTVSRHVRECRLAPGAGEDEVAELVGSLCAAQLPLDRPPWELWLLHGHSPDSFGVLLRASHVWVDGTAIYRALGLLFGTGPDAGAIPATQCRDAAVTPWGVLRSLGRLMSWLPLTAGLTGLAQPVSGRSQVSWARVELTRLRAIGRAYGATVNDVFLVALAGALEAWSGPVGPLALMPVTTRRPDERELLSNFVVGARVRLPAGDETPQRRFAAVRRHTAPYRGLAGTGANERWCFERIPARFGRRLVAMGNDARRVAVTTSNLGCLPGPLAIAGRPVTEALPVPVPMPGQRVFAMLGGIAPTVTVGVATDASVPDGTALVGRWLAELTGLEHAAGIPRPARPPDRLAPDRLAPGRLAPGRGAPGDGAPAAAVVA